jgi:phenylacetate-CoA ligase
MKPCDVVKPITIELDGKIAYEFWESSAVPNTQRAVHALDECIAVLFPQQASSLMRAPFLDRTKIREQQLERALSMVRLAYEALPVYKEKYDAALIDIARVDSWEDFRKLPPLTKHELQRVFPRGCVNPNYDEDLLYSTRSSGSSGATLDIRIDQEALAIDSIQAIRQIYLQSGLRFLPQDEAAFVYTVPWPTPSIGGKYISHFISSLIPPQEIARILSHLKASVLSLYPSVFESILPFVDIWKHSDQKLIIVHSEQSRRETRRQWSELCGAPVLDEYSSEEATRIALELPCGHYHICEDTVIVEILDPVSKQPVKDGESGMIVVTNLLNKAMPFIRYIQGDIGSLKIEEDCHVKWSQLATLEGRSNDAFVTRDGRIIPSGTILDVTYRMMFDCGVSINEFMLVQVGFCHVVLYMSHSTQKFKQLKAVIAKLRELLETAMREKIHLEVVEIDELPYSGVGKKRSIRRSFGPLYA